MPFLRSNKTYMPLRDVMSALYKTTSRMTLYDGSSLLRPSGPSLQDLLALRRSAAST